MGRSKKANTPFPRTKGLTSALLSLRGTLILASANLTAAPGLFIPPGGIFGLEGGTLELPCVDFLNSGGTVNAAGLINVIGNWGNTGAFNAQGGTVHLDDDHCVPNSATITGNASFFALRIDTDSGKQVNFQAGSTQNVGGGITLLGTAGNLLKIRSTVPGSPAFLNVAGGQNINYVDVQDNHATGLYLAPGLPNQFNSIDRGGNSRWFLNLGPEIDPGNGARNINPIPTLSATATLLLGLALSALVSWRSRRRSGV